MTSLHIFFFFKKPYDIWRDAAPLPVSVFSYTIVGCCISDMKESRISPFPPLVAVKLLTDAGDEIWEHDRSPCDCTLYHSVHLSLIHIYISHTLLHSHHT